MLRMRVLRLTRCWKESAVGRVQLVVVVMRILRSDGRGKEKSSSGVYIEEASRHGVRGWILRMREVSTGSEGHDLLQPFDFQSWV
jgi:hypothetical protein